MSCFDCCVADNSLVGAPFFLLTCFLQGRDAVLLRSGFEPSLEYTSIPVYDVAAQTKSFSNKSGRGRGDRRVPVNGDLRGLQPSIPTRSQVDSSLPSKPKLITGYSWIDSLEPITPKHLDELAVATRRIKLMGPLYGAGLQGLLSSVRQGSGGRSPVGTSKYEWEQGTLAYAQEAAGQLLGPACSAIAAHEVVKCLVVALGHVGPNMLLELWDVVWPCPDTSSKEEEKKEDEENKEAEGEVMMEEVKEGARDELKVEENAGWVPRLGQSLGDLVLVLENAFLDEADTKAFGNFSPWLQSMLMGNTPRELVAEGGMRFWATRLVCLLKPGRFRLVCCRGCKGAIEKGETPCWNILSHYKPNIPVLLQDAWLDEIGRGLVDGECSGKYSMVDEKALVAVGQLVYWRDETCVVVKITLEMEVVMLNLMRPCQSCLIVPRSTVRTFPCNEPITAGCGGVWPTWNAGTVRERATGRPIRVRQPSKRILMSVLSLIRCMFEVNRVESSSARARNARDGVISRPANNPALNYSSRRHAICMYKMSPDDTGDMKSTYAAQTLPELYRMSTAYLFRHAGPAFSKAQLVEQIIESKVYEVDKREALMWRSILRSCHPDWGFLLSDDMRENADSVNAIIDSMPEPGDAAGWRAVSKECISMAALSFDEACTVNAEAGGEQLPSSAAGSVGSLVNASGTYTESLESMMTEASESGAFDGCGEDGIITSSLVGATQSSVSERTLCAKATSTIAEKANAVVEPHLILQANAPVSEFNEAHRLDACVHPYLIVNGGGAARDPTRVRQYTPSEMFKYENQLMWRGFAEHPTRNFYSCDVINRHKDLSNARFMIDHLGFGTQRVSTAELVAWSESIKKGVSLPRASHKRISSLRGSLRAIGSRRRGSQYDRQSKKGVLDAYELTLGTANCFWTFNLSEGRDPRVSIILGIVDANGQRHSVNHSMDIGSVTTAEQIIAVARDPYRVAEWYDMMLQAVTDELLVPEGVYDDECDPASGAPARLARGIMGTLVAFFGVNENAQRMALHSHLKLWLAEMRFVQRATQANDITLRHLERVMARFVESLTSALLLGHSDDGIDRFDGEENDKQADVMKAVDLHELSFCDEEGFNVADVRPMGAPSPAEFFRHISPTGAHAVTPSRDVAATEAAFGPAWFERVSKAAVARANRMVQRPGEEAITAATLRRKYVSPVYTGSSRNRNDVDSSHKGSSSTTSGKGAPGAPAIPDGESAAWRGRALRGKIRIRALGVTGPGNIDEFELECATACSRIETQALMHGTRRRTTTPIVPSSGGGPVMSGGIDKVARECTPCCHKTREAKRRGTCRLRFGPDGRAIIDFTYFDDDGIIHLARNHGHLVPNSKTATLTLRVNNSMELAFYGRDSLALSLYVTSYIGKGDLDLYELSLLLVSASEKTDLICPSNAGAGVPGTPGSRGGGGKGLSTTAVAAVRMLNGVSGGVQVGGVMNATVHGGMKLETQSHALFYMKTTPFIMAARSFGPVEGDDACELDGGAIEDSQALEQAVTGDCFSTTLYDDYVNRVNADQKNSIYEEERDTVREIGLLSAFEWCRAWYARTPCAKRGKWKPTSRRLPDGQYAATYNPVSGSFCQTRITKLRVLNYQGIQMPGKDGCAESLARWIVMLHVPYENRIALEGLYNDGVEQDADHPWEAALNCWFDTLDAACEPGTGESTVSVKVVRRSDSLQWVDAGSGWTRLILPSKDVSGGVFFPPCPCPMCAVECPIACLLRGGLKVGGSGVPFCGESDGEDTDDGALYEHLRGCVICKRVNRNCPYGSRRGWTNRYIRYCRDMFDGSDAATRLKVEERRAKAVDVLEHISCAGGHDGADKPYSCDGDLPSGVSEADRDLLERFLVDAGTQDEVLAPPVTRAVAQFGTRLSAFRAGVCLDEADRFQRSTLMTLLGRGSEEPASLVRFRVAIRSVAGPFGEHPISRLPVCSDLRAAQSLLFSGRTTDDASDVEQGVPAVTFPTADALRSGNRVMAAAAADVAMGVSPVGSTLEVSGALTFANAVLEYRLTALQTIQFMLVVACYEVELGGLVDRVFHRRSSRLERVEVFDEATSTTRPEFSEGELRELTRMVTIGFADTEGGFQLGMLVTGTGGTGTYRGRVPVGWLFADAGSN